MTENNAQLKAEIDEYVDRVWPEVLDDIESLVSHRSVEDLSAAEDNARSVAQVAAAAFADRSNVGVETGGVNYAFRVDKEFAVGDFVSFSYSPYTAAQLTLLKQFAGN